MSSRPTIKDLAAQAGVSIATVDRVLNNRSKVREATAQRVLMAAEDIGYHAAGLLKMRFQESKPRKRVTFLLQRSSDHFYQTLGRALEGAVERQRDYPLLARTVFMDEVSPGYIAEQLREQSEGADALVLVALDHHRVSKEVEALHARGIPVITLLSRLSSPLCTGHVGLDYRKVGRTAAWAISRLAKRPGKVGILLGSHRYINQELSEISFISYFRELGSQFQVLQPLLNLDDDRLAAQACAQLLADHPDLVGIYSAGGGVGGMIDTLRSEEAGRDLITVGNELMPSTRDALRDGILDLVIATPVERLAQETVNLLCNTFASRGSAPFTSVQLPAELYVPENI